jgi:hypothetical protein
MHEVILLTEEKCGFQIQRQYLLAFSPVSEFGHVSYSFSQLWWLFLCAWFSTMPTNFWYFLLVQFS